MAKKPAKPTAQRKRASKAAGRTKARKLSRRARAAREEDHPMLHASRRTVASGARLRHYPSQLVMIASHHEL